MGSVNAAAVELGTTWPSQRKAFTRHSLGMPARNPDAIRQRAIDTARQRTSQPDTPSLEPVFVALNHGQLPVRARTGGGTGGAGPPAGDYAALGARAVVELHAESHATKPSTRVWAITRRAGRGHRVADQRTSRSGRRQTDRAARTDRSSRPHSPLEEHQLTADTR